MSNVNLLKKRGQYGGPTFSELIWRFVQTLLDVCNDTARLDHDGLDTGADPFFFLPGRLQHEGPGMRCGVRNIRIILFDLLFVTFDRFPVIG